MEKVVRFASLNASVLIEGESGSGKEVLARALHAESLRASKPWVDLSCATLPEHLIESELFGYEKGAFSGAECRKEGLFEMAHRGTLFLDEVGELPPRLQAKLLRVLDCGSYYRLGGTKKVEVDVRVIAATNRDLREAVLSGEFRKDLYHRLAQMRLQALPLRDRTEDILPIAELFLARQGFLMALSPAAKAALLNYSWPGNARELRNAVISAAATTDGQEIDVADLPEEVRAAADRPEPADLNGLFEALGAHAEQDRNGANGGLLEAMEKKMILDVLRQSHGHHENAARVLGISSRTLSRKLRSYSEMSYQPNESPLSA